MARVLTVEELKERVLKTPFGRWRRGTAIDNRTFGSTELYRAFKTEVREAEDRLTLTREWPPFLEVSRRWEHGTYVAQDGVRREHRLVFLALTSPEFLDLARGLFEGLPDDEPGARRAMEIVVEMERLFGYLVDFRFYYDIYSDIGCDFHRARILFLKERGMFFSPTVVYSDPFRPTRASYLAAVLLQLLDNWDVTMDLKKGQTGSFEYMKQELEILRGYHEKDLKNGKLGIDYQASEDKHGSVREGANPLLKSILKGLCLEPLLWMLNFFNGFSSFVQEVIDEAVLDAGKQKDIKKDDRLKFVSKIAFMICIRYNLIYLLKMKKTWSALMVKSQRDRTLNLDVINEMQAWAGLPVFTPRQQELYNSDAVGFLLKGITYPGRDEIQALLVKDVNEGWVLLNNLMGRADAKKVRQLWWWKIYRPAASGSGLDFIRSQLEHL